MSQSNGIFTVLSSYSLFRRLRVFLGTEANKNFKAKNGVKNVQFQDKVVEFVAGNLGDCHLTGRHSVGLQ